MMETDLSGEREFTSPPWELAEKIARHFESCPRTTLTSAMAVFVLRKWTKFNELTRHWKLYQELAATVCGLDDTCVSQRSHERS
jgi:DNA-binding XRE family transcriptional regulator